MKIVIRSPLTVLSHVVDKLKASGLSPLLELVSAFGAQSIKDSILQLFELLCTVSNHIVIDYADCLL